MKPEEEIHATLKGLTPASGEGFLACPLSRAGASCVGNPDADLAHLLLGWPRRICEAITETFDGDGKWPDKTDKRRDLYLRRFAMAKNAGRRECLEFDNPGSTL